MSITGKMKVINEGTAAGRELRILRNTTSSAAAAEAALAYTLVWGAVPKKTLADLEPNPKAVSYEELLAILRDHGCEVREGTKHGAIANCGGLTLTVPRPHRGKTVGAVFVREAVRLVKGERK